MVVYALSKGEGRVVGVGADADGTVARDLASEDGLGEVVEE